VLVKGKPGNGVQWLRIDVVFCTHTNRIGRLNGANPMIKAVTRQVCVF
jgi:hypothetical protein